MNKDTKTTVLCILDGFGLNPNPEGNAVHAANTPNMDNLMANYPSAALQTSGLRVGLPEGQMGNSEVGHLNIGAGRVVEQWLVSITNKLEQGFLDESTEYKDFLNHSKDSDTIHFIGLYSDGGVHSHLDHLKLFIKRVLNDFDGKLALHLLTDGRDVSPHTAAKQVAELEEFLTDYPRCHIASVSGRFYAMDRDKRWERVERAFKTIALAQGPSFDGKASRYLEESYTREVTDEFIEPVVIEATPMEANDGVIFWNFRADRARELVSTICFKDFEHFERDFSPIIKERTLCFTEYDETFQIPFLFSPIEIKNHIGEVVSDLGLRQLRVAETEKYAHVTYFFSGGVEKQYPGEDRRLIPSPKDVKTYDLKPEMSAYPVAEYVVKSLAQGDYDFIVVNFANSDMVGHTGIMEAAIKAVETVDTCVGQIIEALNQHGGQILIIADHGNSDQMIDYASNSPHTAHTTHPVPVVYYNANTDCKSIKLREDGALCDVAPTLLALMGIEQPEEMTGESLLIQT